MEVSGTTRVLGLIGNPIEHTMSPVIHNTLADLLSINVCYVPFLVTAEEVDTAVKGAYALNVLGLNVTVPYKSDVLSSIVEIDPLAEKIGACNTLVRTDRGYKGYNTDMPGLYRAMQSDGIALCGQDVLILGAGGVARAVALMCATYEAGSITILNRSEDKAQLLATEVKEKTGFSKIRACANEDFRKVLDRDYLAIQCTNVGMHPKVNEVVIDEEDLFAHIEVGYDLIFNPAETLFMKRVRARGKEAYHGLKMLLYQGIIAFELWNHVHVSKEQAFIVYDRMKEAMGLRD